MITPGRIGRDGRRFADGELVPLAALRPVGHHRRGHPPDLRALRQEVPAAGHLRHASPASRAALARRGHRRQPAEQGHRRAPAHRARQRRGRSQPDSTRSGWGPGGTRPDRQPPESLPTTTASSCSPDAEASRSTATRSWAIRRCGSATSTSPAPGSCSRTPRTGRTTDSCCRRRRCRSSASTAKVGQPRRRCSRWSMRARRCGRSTAAAQTHVQGHGLRATFASVAEGLVSAAVLKRMMNHAVTADVTLGHYVAKSDAQLRAGWQAVADWIEAEAQGCETQSKARIGSTTPAAAPSTKALDGAGAGGQLDDRSHSVAEATSA